MIKEGLRNAKQSGSWPASVKLIYTTRVWVAECCGCVQRLWFAFINRNRYSRTILCDEVSSY